MYLPRLLLFEFKDPTRPYNCNEIVAVTFHRTQPCVKDTGCSAAGLTLVRRPDEAPVHRTVTKARGWSLSRSKTRVQSLSLNSSFTFNLFLQNLLEILPFPTEFLGHSPIHPAAWEGGQLENVKEFSLQSQTLASNSKILWQWDYSREEQISLFDSGHRSMRYIIYCETMRSAHPCKSKPPTAI
ncbi:hypothetical protein chiPu_0001354 [Chiloscyllium punctatum]|uniref:Uncharacterized protein n=1 Tax=Chiloscyllium punctatum TaxID=137246 RepID=A0A401RXU7_CHIPU|nr:hypothetical protein [Chiloscyllium punctatum]